jgi:hypothetical protein
MNPARTSAAAMAASRHDVPAAMPPPSPSRVRLPRAVQDGVGAESEPGREAQPAGTQAQPAELQSAPARVIA